MRIIAVVVVLSVIFLRKQITELFPTFGVTFWPHSPTAGVIGDLVTLLGAIVMIWARVKLGKNWSANVVLKENHKLITDGPYAYSRHPIYSGLLLMILGVAIYFGSFTGFFLFVLFFWGARYKAFKEEKLLTQHFPVEYPVYKKRVRALVPFIF